MGVVFVVLLAVLVFKFTWLSGISTEGTVVDTFMPLFRYGVPKVDVDRRV